MDDLKHTSIGGIFHALWLNFKIDLEDDFADSSSGVAFF